MREKGENKCSLDDLGRIGFEAHFCEACERKIRVVAFCGEETIQRYCDCGERMKLLAWGRAKTDALVVVDEKAGRR
jgi:hypothetical protein